VAQVRTLRRPRVHGSITEQIASWAWAQLKGHLIEPLARWALRQLAKVPRRSWAVMASSLVLAYLVGWLHRHLFWGFPVGILLGAGITGLPWLEHPLLRLPALTWMRERRWPITAIAGGGTLWIVPAWIMGVGSDQMIGLSLEAGLLALYVGLGARPIRLTGAGIDPHHVLEQWEELIRSHEAIAKALGGSTARLRERNHTGFVLRVHLAPGHIAEDVIAVAGRLASVIRHQKGSIRRGGVSVLSDDQAGACLLRVTTKDVLAKGQRWPGPSSDDILQPVQIGYQEDAQPLLLRLMLEPGLGRNLQIAGMNGSGKSGAVNLLMAVIAGCLNARVWGAIDPEGTELPRWAPCIDSGRVVMTAKEAAEVITEYRELIELRGQELIQRGQTFWIPTPEEPELWLIIDELALIAAQAPACMEVLGDIAQRGRKRGMHLILATQRPSAQALGGWGTTLLGQCHSKLCLRLERANDVGIALGPGSVGQGWRAHEMLLRAGEVLVADGEHPAPIRSRLDKLSREDVERWAAELALDHRGFGEG
jgi:DNA segregation ATPase FtsK/SpoIIIE, S-DNA-T family